MSHAGPRAVLIGAMGSGKSTVAEALASRLAVSSRDTDHEVENLAGCSVQDIFVNDGEAAFRTLEKQAVAEALQTHDGVLSLGGGAVLDPETRVLLHDHTVIFLQVSMPEAVRRIGMGQTRPLLNQAVGGVRSRFKALLDERTPIYQELATHVVDTDGLTPDQVADQIEGLLR
ncbi:MAG: shikimate kinase [Nocardioides sp.]